MDYFLLKDTAMKKLIISLLINLSFYSISNAGIPVIDATSIAKQVQQIVYLTKQLNELKEQVITAKETMDRQSGSRGMGAVISSVYDPAMTVSVPGILSSNGIHNSVTLGLSGDAAMMYDQANNVTAQYLGQTEKTLQQSQARFTELLKLIAKVNNAPEQKDILDLQARIEAENTMLQNEMIKLMSLKAKAEAEQQMYERKKQQRHLNVYGSSRDLHF